ncbi:uncharacterized protein K452DRAFT_237228 [Aplosporella prunicola CBS 121167]|uniref:Uncharacterized protein n=1 Tax=Aplosporella prunicola CBS 121167 TaxID=1176127 RepID=A0A6A6AX97_9PEZI|nr:uncharacterized protein K452DRAFT_237228 [Aplosporella prunicola CBS 121167]KAF2136592.1 hypothetical protein K452DRAFT_237228 [Aplosporella prunicola CBS 121167]
MTETLLSVLCRDPWCYDRIDGHEIRFRNDGTGYLVLRYELSVPIAAEIEWKSPAPLKEIKVDMHAKGQEVLAQFDIELTLTKRVMAEPGIYPNPAYKRNEHFLTEGAFVPKKYTVSIQKGKFFAPLPEKNAGSYWMPGGPFGIPDKSWQCDRFALRLTFDKSPYPPYDDWKDCPLRNGDPKPWTYTAFSSWKLLGEAARPTVWNTECVVQ